MTKKNKLIGIGGKAGSGKSTLATFIQSRTGQHIAAFADPLKSIVSSLTGCNKVALNDSEFKNKTLGSEWDHHTYRYLLQKIGTDLFRDQLNENVWVNALFAKWKDEPIIIPDVRFKNEFAEIKKRGGITIYVDRDTEIKSNHKSETELSKEDFDLVVTNNSSFEKMYNFINNKGLW